MENLFFFTEVTKGTIGDEVSGKYCLKENELEQKHKDLILGKLLKVWNESPGEVQRKFSHIIIKDMSKGKVVYNVNPFNQSNKKPNTLRYYFVRIFGGICFNKHDNNFYNYIGYLRMYRIKLYFFVKYKYLLMMVYVKYYIDKYIKSLTK